MAKKQLSDDPVDQTVIEPTKTKSLAGTNAGKGQNPKIGVFEEEEQEQDDPEDQEEEALYDPHSELTHWFDRNDNLDWMKGQLDHFFEAAIAESYCWGGSPDGEWDGDTPVHCLQVHDQMLILIGIAHYLWEASTEQEEETQQSDKPIAFPEIMEYCNFPDAYPRLLTAAEWQDPISVLADFFEYLSYEEWSEKLHLWLEAALSEFGVTEGIDDPDVVPADILPFCRHLHLLIEACFVIMTQREPSGAYLVTGLNPVDSPFSEIIIRGKCRAQLIRSDEQSIHLEGEWEACGIRYEISDGTLTITGNRCGRNITDEIKEKQNATAETIESISPRLVIRYREIKKLEVDQLAEVALVDHKEKYLNLLAIQGANLSGTIDVQELEAIVTGHAQIDLSGKADILQLSGYSEGQCRMGTLAVSSAKVHLKDSANAHVNVSHLLEYFQSEDSQLSWVGEPIQKIEKTSEGSCVYIFAG